MKNTTKIAVIGGGGRTGKFIIAELLRHGYQPKVLLRKASSYQSIHRCGWNQSGHA
jgi:putative NADH-flavin reductase